MNGPYWDDGQVQLWHGDFRDVLPGLGVVPDLVVVDPPYQETSLGWDRWVDGWPSLIPGNSMWCFGSMRMFLDRRDEFEGWKLAQDVVWEKHNGSGFATDRFNRVHEFGVHWYRGRWEEVHHETPRWQTGGKRTMVRRAPTGARWHGEQGPSMDFRDGSTLARSVIYVPSTHGKAVNETEKPRGILEPLIEYGCPPGGLVLDVFAGSCSTLVAARALGRRAVGVEKREEQCELAVKYRLSQTVLTFDGAL